ncbi:hypothetical protein [uncultured Parabacteroides sp.]|uniref:hypothetical protein n=1 Tax=uncultured Parabacteroides sp. TaxID=512312 RepID=UPI0028042154|nr:hypothetical protein [uncultured Parabacteroides sp.]
MKRKLSLFFLVLFLSISVYGQKRQPVDEVASIQQTSDWQAHYWKKHKTFKALGWTFSMVGVASVGGAYCLALSGLEAPYSKSRDVGSAALLIGGGCLILASIPMFCLGYSNKRKARSISLQGQNLSSPLPDGSVSFRPGVSLCMTF